MECRGLWSRIAFETLEVNSSKRCNLARFLERRPEGSSAPTPTQPSGDVCGPFRVCLQTIDAPLLLQPRGVVAFPWNSVTSVEFKNPASYVVQEVAVVRHCDDGAGNSCKKRSNQATDSASRWFVGSSNNSISGADSRSLHSATRRRSPPESLRHPRPRR